MHTERLRRTGALGPAQPFLEVAPKSQCAAEGCDRPARNMAAEYCRLHDYRMQRHGSLDKPPVHNKRDGKECRECGETDEANFYGYLKRQCKPCYRAYQRAYDRQYREKRGFGKGREWQMRRDYGIDLAEYLAMFDAQGGACAICRQDPTEGERPKSLHVDHNHSTGKVRGLLCNGCNRALGFALDNPAILRAAADYLEDTA
jgi:hypothetical protein